MFNGQWPEFLMDDIYSHLTLRRDFDIMTIELTDRQLSRSRLTTDLESELLDLITKEQPLRVVVNFQHVERCSTAVMNSMLRIKRRIVTKGGQLKLCAMNDSVRGVYKMLNLDGTVFEIYDTLDDAYAGF